MRWINRGVLALALVLTLPPLFADVGQERARKAAERFAVALCSGDPSAARPILPASGRILVSLAEDTSAAYYAPAQLEALLQQHLSHNRLTSCRVEDLAVEGGSYARVELAAERTGAGVRVRFRIALQPEQDRWVLRELRETIR